MPDGALTSYLDVAQLTLYGFWLFFFGLIFWLRREDRREGYPTEDEYTRRPGKVGVALIPPPKEFDLIGGGTKQAPSFKRDSRELAAERGANWPGAPIEPTGDPMVDGIGPAAWAERKDEPELTRDGRKTVVPMRVASDFVVAAKDVDPRGAEVFGADGELAGKVDDLWVDRADPTLRYLEIILTADETKKVLVPMVAARVTRNPMRIDVKSLMAAHFANVPTLKDPDQITVLEEDRICAYYAGGRLYAEPSRMGPLV